MIPVPNTLVQFDNLPGEEIEFGIGDPRWVMQTQAELYSDVETAITREYSTNARDANVMAGKADVPIRVTLPSVMHKFFTVEDDGVGMNIDLFKRVYTQFGVSDKRQRSDTNGMLGYGSKSGVAYTDQFSVTSVRDGIKIEGVVMRKPDWSIVLKVVSQERTDRPNGTRIVIPVHNVEEFCHKANEFYKYWLPGRVLVNGKPPVHNVGKEIAKNLYYSKEWNSSYVVMGNVPYRINNPAALFRNSKMGSLNFVAYVDNFKTADGSAPVEFTPSREDLKYTPRTKETLQAIIDQFEKDILETAKSEIDNAKSHAEAFERWSFWTSALGKAMFADLEYKGDKFKSDFKFVGSRYAMRNSYGYATQTIREWHVESMKSTMVVTGFDITLASAHKKKVREYAQLMGWTPTYALFTSADDVDCVWIPKDKFVDWEDLKAALPKAPPKVRQYNTGPRRIAGTFDYFTKDDTHYEKPLPTPLGEVMYITVKDSKSWAESEILKALDSDAVVVVLAVNRINKFTRENPTVKEFTAWAKSKVVIDGASLLSDKAKEVRAIDYETRQWLRALDMTKVVDPEMHRLHRLIKDEKTLNEAYENNLRLARLVKRVYDVKGHNVTKTVGSLYVKYPLLRYIGYNRILPHVYLYLNAAHAAELENKND